MKRLFLLLCFLALFTYSYAQTGSTPAVTVTGKISGIIIDSLTNKPLDYATVTLFRSKGRVPLNGVLTDDKGSFKFNNINPGSYKVTVTYIGYPTKTFDPITTTPGKPDNNMGNIILSPAAGSLKEITVTGQAAVIENRVDKVVYNAERDNTVSGGNAGDLLRKVPMVAVDQDGNVSLRGSQNVRILINGKPTGAVAGSVADAMKMLPADQVKTVEVITSPSAKYDAEGTAGIINIITKRKEMSGVSGSLSGGLGTRQNNGNANLNINKNRLSITGNAGGNSSWPQTSTLAFSSADDVNKSRSDQSGTSKTKRYAGVGSGNLSYDFNNFNSFSSGIRFNQAQFSTDGLSQNTSSSTAYGSQAYTITNDSETQFGGFDWNADFTHKFKTEGQEITFAGQWSHGKTQTDFTSLYSAFNSNQIGNNDGKNDEYTAQLDYVQPFNKSLKLETGAKSIARKINSVYDFYNQVNGVYAFNSTASNVYDYKQDVYSGYAVLSFQLKGGTGLQIGSRLENTQIDGGASSQVLGLSAFTNSYTNFIPSFAISKTFKGTQTFRLSYSKRIQRPSLQNINPFRNTANKQAQSVGNPKLSPEVAQNVELNYSTFIKSSIINASVYYKNTDGLIESFVTREAYESTDASGTVVNQYVSLTSFGNIGHNNSLGTSIFIQLNPVKALTLRSNINAFTYKPRANGAFQSISGNDNTYVQYNAFASASLALPHGLNTETYLIANSPKYTFQGKNPSFNMWILNMNKEILKKKGKIGINVIDPFNERKNFKSRITNNSLVQSSKFSMPFRSVGVNFSWTFGKINFTQQQPKKKRGVNNDDLKQDGGQTGQQGSN